MPAPEKYMNAAEIQAHPEYSLIHWPLEPSRNGFLPVATGRGGPFRIYWEIHGTGPTRLVLVMGLGATRVAWQRQTKDFGHDAGDKYSVLIVDNRGIGKSDKPLMRYTTSEMAKDLLELLEHVGWAEPRTINLYGISMGGMIAQEFAYANPLLINSLILTSTTARLANTIGFFANLQRRALMFMPKSPDQQLEFTASLIFSDDWLWAPDEINGAFQYNRDRFAAGELSKKQDRESYTFKGFVLQAIAANWHHKSAQQLKEMSDAVGRERILLMHGKLDNMITIPNGYTLAADLGDGVTTKFFEDVGHCPPFERRRECHELVDNFIGKASALNKK